MSDVREWLGRLGLGKYAEAFAANAIEFDVLADLSDAELREIGVAAVGDRKRLLGAIAALESRTTGGPATTPNGQPASAWMQPTADRREVVVLFADIVGYTALARRFDAEELHRLLERYFRLAGHVVKGHGGRIDKHIGDSVMAVFGAPVALGNDAERALLAALGLRDQTPSIALPDGTPLQVHIGLASGPVLASRTGSEHFEEYTVTGDAVNLASRLVAVARAGEIVVTDRLHRELEHHLISEPLGPVALRGISDDQTLHRVLGFNTARGRADRPIVGRQAELEQFEGALTRSIRDRRGTVVLVRGEAGIGKTRLIFEFLRRATDLECRTLRVSVVDFGASDGREPVAALARVLVGMDLAAGEPTVELEALLGDGVFEPQLHTHLFDALGLPQPEGLAAAFSAMDNDTRTRGRRAVLKALVDAATRRGPVCLAVEDVHWATRSFVDLLADVASASSRLPLALLLTTRPEGDPIDRAWRTQSSGVALTTFDLSALHHEDVQAMAAAFSGLSPATVERCIARASGHPLFLEQLLLHASDGADEDVPGSVASLVVSRLDRLSPSDKRAAQAASVLGQRFSLDTLRHLLRDPRCDCDSLLAAHIVRRDGDDLMFVHALVRDGAYASLLKASRANLHRQAAEWYGSRDAVLHAEHLEQADDARAGDALVTAARSLLAICQPARSLPLVERALRRGGLTDNFGTYLLKTTLLRDLGRIAAAAAAADEAIGMANLPTERCDALVARISVARMAGRFEDALRDLDLAETAVGEDKARLATICYMRGNIFFPLGRVEECQKSHKRALGFAVETASPEAEAGAHSGLGDAAYLAGHMRSADRSFRRAVEIARAQGFLRVEASNLYMIAQVAAFDGPADRALDLVEGALSAARAIGDLRAEGWAWSVRGNISIRAGNADALRKDGEETRRCGAAAGSPLLEVTGRYTAAYGSCLNGDRPNGVSELRDVMVFARKSAMRFLGPSVLGAIARFTDDPGEAEAAVAEAEATLAFDCASHNHINFRETRVLACLERGDWDGVESNAEALEQFARSEPFLLSQTIGSFGRTLAQFGNGERSGALVGRLRALRRMIAELGWDAYLPALDGALVACSAA